MLFSQPKAIRLLTVFMALFLTACSEENSGRGSEQNTIQQSHLPVLEVYKKPTCRCCSTWMVHLEDQGIETNAHHIKYLSAFKAEKSIPPRFQSCHTAVSQDGYVFEGHIPAKYIHQFLQEKPDGAIGLAVPAMPVGSPGMEAGRHFRPYAVLLLKGDGSAEIYAQIKTQEEQYQ